MPRRDGADASDRRLRSPELPQLNALAFDARVLIVSMLTTIAAGLLVGTLPAFRAAM